MIEIREKQTGRTYNYNLDDMDEAMRVHQTNYYRDFYPFYSVGYGKYCIQNSYDIMNFSVSEK